MVNNDNKNELFKTKPALNIARPMQNEFNIVGRMIRVCWWEVIESWTSTMTFLQTLTHVVIQQVGSIVNEWP